MIIEPPSAAIIGSALLLHPRDGAGEVDIDDVLPLAQVELLELGAAGDAGVVSQGDDRAELGDG